MKNGKRLEILLKIGMLEDEHCKKCELFTHENMYADEKFRYFYTVCNIGLKMQELGKELKLKDPEPPPTKKKTKSDVIIELHLEGHDNGEIAQITGYSKKIIPTTISRYRKKNGLPSVKVLKKAEVKELIRKGNSMSDIRKITGYSKGYIYKMIKGIQENANTNIR